MKALMLSIFSQLIVILLLAFFLSTNNRKKIGSNLAKKLVFASIPFLLMNIPYALLFATPSHIQKKLVLSFLEILSPWIFFPSIVMIYLLSVALFMYYAYRAFLSVQY
jgi:hypothetical protein